MWACWEIPAVFFFHVTFPFYCELFSMVESDFILHQSHSYIPGKKKNISGVGLIWNFKIIVNTATMPLSTSKHFSLEQCFRFGD